MKRSICLFAMLALFGGCASTASDDAHPGAAANDPHGIYSDPTYPGPGVRFGVGVGSWGGHRGSGAGFGIGF